MFKIFQESKTIKWIESQKDSINFSPVYQRLGRLWKKEQKQLLIDSIFNGFDIPKLYFQFMPPYSGDKFYNYAIIDGKQRIEAILGFISGEFPLSSEFTFVDQDLEHTYGDISGKYFNDVESCAPAVIARFWQYELNIVFIDTTSPDTINEMFIRLNSGISVNTAEKRNATGGQLSINIQRLCDNAIFFTQKIKISNRRFEHNDLAIKLLMLELGLWDLTKNSVNKFVSENKEFEKKCETALKVVKQKLKKIESSFEDKDKLLSKKNIIVTLFAILDKIPEGYMHGFMEYFEECRYLAQEGENSQEIYYDLIEFTRLLQQGADKKSSIQQRCSTMLNYLKKYLHST